MPSRDFRRSAAVTTTSNTTWESGERGSRYIHAEAILCELTGAEAALVVNNNAGAVFLVLNTLAKGREVWSPEGNWSKSGDLSGFRT